MKRVFRICRNLIKIELKMVRLDPWLEDWLEKENRAGRGYYEGDLDDMNDNIKTLKQLKQWDNIRRYDPVAALGREVETWDFNDPEEHKRIKNMTEEAEAEERTVGINVMVQSFKENPDGRVDDPADNTDLNIVSGDKPTEEVKIEASNVSGESIPEPKKNDVETSGPEKSEEQIKESAKAEQGVLDSDPEERKVIIPEGWVEVKKPNGTFPLSLPTMGAFVLIFFITQDHGEIAIAKVRSTEGEGKDMIAKWLTKDNKTLINVVCWITLPPLPILE